MTETFALSRPDCLLKDYIDDLEIRCEYHRSGGETLP